MPVPFEILANHKQSSELNLSTPVLKWKDYHLPSLTRNPMHHRTTACFLILLLLCCGLKCNTDVARVVLPEVTKTSETTPLFEMEAILATRSEVHSPIPDDVYDLLWGHWTEAGLSAPRDYYTKYIDADGIAIVGGNLVDDGLFQAARHVVLVMTSKVPGLREALSITTPGVDNPNARFRLAILQGSEESATDLPDVADTQYGSIFFYPLAAAQISRFKTEIGGVTRNGPHVRIVIHEMAHAIHHILISRPHLFPEFGERLGNAWHREMEHFRLREEEGLPLNNNLHEPYRVCFPRNTVYYIDAWEFWATFVDNNWLDEWNTPDYLSRDPNHEERRKHCPGLAALAEDIFPAFPLAVVIAKKDYPQ